MGSLVPGWDQDQPGQKPFAMQDEKKSSEESLPWWLKGSKDATAFQDTQARLEQEQFEQEMARSPSGKYPIIEGEGEQQGGRPQLGRSSLGRRSFGAKGGQLERKSFGTKAGQLERKSSTGKPQLSRKSGDKVARANSFSQIDDIIKAAEEAVEYEQQNPIHFDMETDDQGKIRYQWWKRMNTSELNARAEDSVVDEGDYKHGSYIPQYDISTSARKPTTATAPPPQENKENQANGSLQQPLILI
eukprot:TRINITY_DN647_c1_g2_i1.p1 TRINITY_DN647_c1_g2~~TRINITY_DN647_c1_g2_i1.p1  ORF type:complete len:245 (+),score=44.65 TRINITY_DN647_c1_g2_i1:154-888(+)